ncbi:MAG: PLP-dependent aminotransferase family protein [Anaerolineae bacterium]|nr:PLP-dependent aminotransferase family protein [Anaerolineae bacterium]
MPISWTHRYAQRTQRMTSSAIRELLKVTEQPDMISFAGGLPAPEIFPVEEMAVAADRVLRDFGPQALQYSTTEGYRPLREWVAQHTAPGLTISPDNILITSGSQQALDLLGKIFINPGDRLVVEAPTYMGALQAFDAYEAEYIAVPSDEQGMITATLEPALQVSPKLIYTMPTFQNPTGVTLTLERRQQLVDLAQRYGVPIIEDDAYGELRFEGEPIPKILEVGGSGLSEGDYNGSVIYLSTFSKTLAPGLRLAWIVAPLEVIRKLVQAKQGADLHSATFNQMIAYEAVRDGFLQRHLPVIRRVYRERREVMLAALAEHFPPEAHWTHPDGGLFLWVTLPPGISGVALLPAALAAHVAFVPGEPMFPNGGGENTLRLNFSNATPAQIREGIARLGRVLAEQLGR